MGAKVTFNELTRIIEIDEAPDVNGEVFIDVKADLYSDGKEDWVANENLRKVYFPLSSVGGNPLPGSKALGSTFFIRPDWKIAPYEASHRLIINGNFYSEDGEDPFLDTQGTYTVRIMQQVSSLVDSTIAQLDEIEYASFNGGVTVDVVNGVPGTGEYLDDPIGTPRVPSNNLTDALAIATDRGFTRLYIRGDIDFDSALDFSNFEVVGESPAKSLITIDGLATTTGMEIKFATVTGILDGENFLSACTVTDLEYVNGRLFNCGLIGDIELSGGADAVLNDCYTVDQDNPPVIDLGGTGQSLVMPNYSGLCTLHNLSDSSQEVGVGMDAGAIILDKTITAGTIIIAGVGTCTDEFGTTILTGTWNGNVNVNTSALLSNASLSNAVWTTSEALELLTNIEYIKDVESGRWKMDTATNQMIFYKADNLTEVVRFDLFNKSGAPDTENIYERTRDNSSDDNWKYPRLLQINVGSIASGVLTDVQADNGDHLQLAEVIGSPGFDFVFSFTGVANAAIQVDINGYYQGNPAHNVKIKILNINTYLWEDLTADSQDFPNNTTDQDYSFNLPFPFTDYRTVNGDVNLKIQHESNGSNGHYLWIDLMELNTQ